jgi:hypothetical protein
MGDWRNDTSSFSFGRDDSKPPALRPLFEAPERWTPALDGSLASAILRSLAYGQGDERLDNKLVAVVNRHVACLRDMKSGLPRDFDQVLARHGYGYEKG